MQPPENARSDSARSSVNRDWLRALQRTAAIETDVNRILPVALDDVARRQEATPALLSTQESFSFGELSRRSLRYARWGLARGLRKGDVVALMMPSRPEYVAIWLGLNRIGVIVALININLSGEALAHSLRVATPRIILAAPPFASACAQAQSESATLVTHDEALLREIDAQSAAALTLTPAQQPALGERALYIYTSGTTGLPKAAIVTHRRIMHWAVWFGGLADIGPQDRMYNCLPLYHSVGGVVAIFTPLLAGGSVFLRDKFSARAFWSDIVANDCTLFQYIGELCRYLTHAPPCDDETRHRLRLALGNGLRPDVWQPFVSRFRIPRVIEFYAATESNFALYNVEGEPGAIGRIPAFLAAHQFLRLIKYDADSDAPARGADGFCIACAVDEPGEAIAKIVAREANGFEGYLDRAASEKKILRDVFAPGDAWMRSGDLMRKDGRGFFYFVDRVGDTFRWKGENVATAEVAQALSSFPGVRDVNVYGVSVPGADGRAGMAALVVDDAFDIAALRPFLDARLPAYARPLFVRLTREIEITDTFKHKKQALAAEGFDPRALDAPVYFASAPSSLYSRLDASLYEKIISGDVAL